MAQRIPNGQISFETRELATDHDEGTATARRSERLGPTVKIRYDPADPEHVIVDDSTLGRDITFTIVALKLLVGGSVFTVLGLGAWRTATAAR